jgi:hypothetical protein
MHQVRHETMALREKGGASKMSAILEEKLFDEEQQGPENEPARFLRNMRDHGFASSNEQFSFALARSPKQEASGIATQTIEDE